MVGAAGWMVKYDGYTFAPITTGLDYTILRGVAWRPDENYALIAGGWYSGLSYDIPHRLILKYNGNKITTLVDTEASSLWKVSWSSDMRCFIAGENETLLANFSVAAEMVQELISYVEELELGDSAQGLIGILDAAIIALENADEYGAMGVLTGFMNQVKNNPGLGLTDEERAELVAAAQEIIDNL
jgi:hypothetical protein